MKSAVMIFLMLFSGIVSATQPITTEVPIEAIYVPYGFDSNDNAQIVVSGWLPNLCYKNVMTNVTIDNNKVNVKLTSHYYPAMNSYCTQVIIPFVEVIDLGLMQKGNYQLVVNENSYFQKRSKLNIAQAQATVVDDYIYANVEYVDREVGNGQVTLRGENPSDCFTLKEVKFMNNGLNTISILPIVERASGFCAQVLTPFSYDIQVPTDLNANKILLHVRAMDGRSVNKVYSFDQN
ncbi:MAG: hypothetical protein ACPGJV_14060 [Bacteriovoracaceae bacterium]